MIELWAALSLALRLLAGEVPAAPCPDPRHPCRVAGHCMTKGACPKAAPRRKR